jgi:ribulose kinase
MQPEVVVALDAGGGSGRSAVFDAMGNLLGMATEDWAARVPEDEPLGAEFDPQEIWAALCRTTRQALERTGLPP